MRDNKILKTISYIVLPILIIIIVMSFAYTDIREEYDYMMSDSYFDSNNFAKKYMSNLQEVTYDLIYSQSDYSTMDNKTRLLYRTSENYSSISLKKDLFLVIYKDKAITNVSSETTIDGIKNYINNEEGEHLVSINGNLKSNPLNYYINYYKDLLDHSYYNNNNKSTEVQTAKFEDYEIYTVYTKEFSMENAEGQIVSALKFVKNYENVIYSSIPICAVFSIIIVVYLIISIGHTKGKKEIDINDLDKIPLEIILTIAWLAIYVTVIVISHIINRFFGQEYYKLCISSIICAYLVIYTVVMISLTTFIKRIKSNMIVQTTIFGKLAMAIIKIFNKLNDASKKVSKEIAISMNNATKLILWISVYIIVMVLIVVIFFRNIFFAFLIDACITIYVIYQIIRRIKSFEMIEKHLKEIYEGNIDKKLNPDDFCQEFRNMVVYINDISNGFENAIQEGIKSERLKTELITNVSHDIKTPLTSIINYVDLLKQENIKNKKVEEYIAILDNKSHRLKRLTEDLVEASKASSGNVKLNFEKIGITELINQTTAEFEEKFKEKGLEVITSFPEEETYIKADSRYMYRIIENSFSNIAKYALKDSRVYIDVKTDINKVSVCLKNISAEKLNISEEELMQRFVRGDKSRTTEGSGLGLSIAKSLTELQKGKFSIQIDGDLFKVELEFDKVKS